MIVSRILTTIGSIVSISLGIWHFTVPSAWNWYSYITPEAKELVTAVRAVNIFFSLSLVLFGIITILIMFGKNAGSYSRAVLLGAVTVLWLTRVVTQIVWPQGSMNPILQYGMLSLFTAVFLCFLVSLFLVLKK